MRIAIVSDYFLDYVGGAQTSMLQQERALRSAGHEVVIVAPSRTSTGEQNRFRIPHLFTAPGVQLPVVANSSRTRTRLRNLFRERAIQAVHVQTEFGLAHAAAQVAHELGLPVVHTVHTFYWVSEGVGHRLAAGPLRAALRLLTGVAPERMQLSPRGVDNVLRNTTLAMARTADVVISPSAHQAADLRSAGVPGPIHVVPNPMVGTNAPAAPLSEDLISHPVILWVARCEAVKRPLVFAEAAVQALRARPGRFSVHFVGDGSELAALRRTVEGHPTIHVHGALDHDAVLAMIDRSSLVALTSVGFDNQPMTIAEAVSRDRGVLYCDPKLQEGLGRAGLLAPQPSSEALAHTLIRLVDEPALIPGLSEGARADKHLFGAAAYVAAVEKLYVGSNA